MQLHHKNGKQASFGHVSNVEDDPHDNYDYDGDATEGSLSPLQNFIPLDKAKVNSCHVLGAINSFTTSLLFQSQCLKFMEMLCNHYSYSCPTVTLRIDVGIAAVVGIRFPRPVCIKELGQASLDNKSTCYQQAQLSWRSGWL